MRDLVTDAPAADDASGGGLDDAAQDEVASVPLVDAVVAAGRIWIAIAARSLGDLGEDVTLPQFRALGLLSSQGPLRLGQLARLLAVEPPTASRLCDRLIRKDLITRSQNPKSRREVQIELSAKGSRFLEVVNGRRRTDIVRILTSLPDESRDRLRRSLVEFTQAGEAAGVTGSTRFAL